MSLKFKKFAKFCNDFYLMNIYIDTAAFGCHVALFDEAGILASESIPIERGHAEAIIPLYQKLLEKIDKQPSNIQGIYVNVGPGSFTGLRVGLTAAKFIGFSLGIDVQGVSSFQVFSSHMQQDDNRLVILETKRDDFYSQMMDANHNPLSGALCLSAEDVIKHHGQDNYIVGDAVNRFTEVLNLRSDKVSHHDMLDVENVIKAIQSGKMEFSPSEAFYAREADISKPKKSKII